MQSLKIFQVYAFLSRFFQGVDFLQDTYKNAARNLLCARILQEMSFPQLGLGSVLGSCTFTAIIVARHSL